jgi:hypothetical protein
MLGAVVKRVNDNSAQSPRHLVVHCVRKLRRHIPVFPLRDNLWSVACGAVHIDQTEASTVCMIRLSSVP